MVNRNALRRSFFAAFARLVGIVLGAAGGSWLSRTGREISSSNLAILLIAGAFALMWVSEYERVN